MWTGFIIKVETGSCYIVCDGSELLSSNDLTSASWVARTVSGVVLGGAWIQKNAKNLSSVTCPPHTN